MLKTNKKFLVAVLVAVFCLAAVFSLFTSQTSAAIANELDPDKTELLEENSEQNVTVQSGLGLGINVVTAQSLTDFKTGNSIFDPEKLAELSVTQFNMNETLPVESYSTTNASTLITNYNSSYNLGAGVEAFFDSISADLGFSTSTQIAAYSYKYYFVAKQNINSYRLYINNYKSRSTYEDCYSDGFLEDLDYLVHHGNFEEFYNKYGTHVVGSAIYGGRLSVCYSLASNEIVLNEDTKTRVDTSCKFDIMDSDMKVNIQNSLATEFGISVDSVTIDENFRAYAKGGSVLANLTLSTFQSSYTSWCNSFSSANNNVLVDYDADGLVPIWEILPDGYSHMVNPMRGFYQYYCQNKRTEFINKFKTANYVDFDGGTGTAADPFLIGDPEQLLNIETTYMNGCYKLTSDLDLSGFTNWKAIGGHYKAKAFNGTFDGDGHSIKNLTRTSNITEKNSRSYFGLFGYIGSSGIVRNLKFEDINISFSGPAVNNNSTRVFIGAVAGVCNGKIQNVTVESGTVEYVCDTNGVAFVGGIAGLVNGAEITSCTNKAAIKSLRYSGVAGGIAGYGNGTTFRYCTNEGSVTAQGSHAGGSHAGGILGECYKEDGDNYEECLYYFCSSTVEPVAGFVFFGHSNSSYECAGTCDDYLT